MDRKSIKISLQNLVRGEGANMKQGQRFDDVGEQNDDDDVVVEQNDDHDDVVINEIMLEH